MSAAPPNRPLLIVADDEPDTRRLLVMLLEHAGFDVLEAENGQRAVDLALLNDIRLAVLDVSMPVLDGAQAATLIRKAKPSVGIVFHTSLQEADVRRRFVGAAGFLQKPADITKLVALVTENSVVVSTPIAQSRG